MDAESPLMTPTLATLTAAAFFVGALASGASQSATPQETAAAGQTQAVPLPAPPADDKNAATYTRVCSLCHDGQRILSNRRTRDQWGELIDKMVERGAQGSDDDFAAVLEYLVMHYGRINVNRGAVKDLTTVLKISDKDAEAIAAYRKDNGPIADFETLSKVPGIDADKLAQSRDAISY